MSQRKLQRQKLLELLRKFNGNWCALPAILDLGIAQYNARIFELRREGYVIENKVERATDGVRHSWYRLVPREMQRNLYP
jgi:helix-turn-helix protein